MTKMEKEIILRASQGHRYLPSAFSVALAGFAALPSKQQAKAINIYLTLIAERGMPILRRAT